MRFLWLNSARRISFDILQIHILINSLSLILQNSCCFVFTVSKIIIINRLEVALMTKGKRENRKVSQIATAVTKKASLTTVKSLFFEVYSSTLF